MSTVHSFYSRACGVENLPVRPELLEPVSPMQEIPMPEIPASAAIQPPRSSRRRYSESEMQLAGEMLARLKQRSDLHSVARHAGSCESSLSDAALDRILDAIEKA